MRQVDHHLLAQARGLQHRAGGVDVGRAVVRALRAAAQDDMAVLVAAGLEDGGSAHLGHAHEGVRRAGGQDGVGGDADAAVGAVLEADRAAQAGGELAVALALGGACADRAPGDQLGDVLRAEQVEELGGRRQAGAEDVEQQRAGALQALVDREAAVQVRVVDVALPAHRGARLLEVDAHHHQQLAAQRVGQRLQARGVFHRLSMVVDRAGPDDDDQPVIAAVQHVGDLAACLLDQRLRGLADRQPLVQQRRRDQGSHRIDAGVVDAGGVVGAAARAGFTVVAGIVEGVHGEIVRGRVRCMRLIVRR